MSDITAEQLAEPAWLDQARSREDRRQMAWRLGRRPHRSMRVSDETLAALWRDVREEQGR